MATQTDVKQRLAVLRATLAKAAKACPHCGDSTWPGHCPYVEGQCTCGGIECAVCQGTGEVAMFEGFRQARAGGLEDALAGLNKREAIFVCSRLPWDNKTVFFSPMPDRDTILVKALKLVCEVTGVEVPPPCAS